MTPSTRRGETLFRCTSCEDSVSALRILGKKPGEQVVFWMPESALFCPWCKAPIQRFDKTANARET